nr:glycine zipper 2TM domain-containing protein [Rhodobacter sp.]
MNKLTATLGAALMLVSSGVLADHGPQQHSYGAQQGGYEYGRVIDVRPIYREVEVSSPLRECYEVPVYHTERHHKSAGGMLAGGIIGGIIGHQIGDGSGQKIATAVGTLVGDDLARGVIVMAVDRLVTDLRAYQGTDRGGDFLAATITDLV